MPGTEKVYSGKIVEVMHTPKRSMLLSTGKIKLDHFLFKWINFETYCKDEFQKGNRITFNLDLNKNPINLKKLDIFNV